MASHDSLYLLRHVVTTPRIMYTLRTSPFTDSNELFRYDETIQSTLSSTMNIELTESGWRQAVLPVRWGGLGIRSSVQLAPSAFMASTAGSASLLLRILLQRLSGILDKSMTLTTMAWNKATESADGVPAVQPTTKSQRLWDDPCCKAASLDLTNTAPDFISRSRHYASYARRLEHVSMLYP